nr:polysaccharide deacetylase family protein [uncultured Acetatifactor sp.]
MKVYTCFPEGKTKALTMSYDDGRLQDERLVDIFNRNGIKGTFNLNYGLMEKDGNRIARERVRELYQGHEVATHCLTHPTIARCPLVEVAYEILEDRKGLEGLTGGLVRGHAYPNGSYSPEIKALFRQLGIAYGRVVEARADYELPKDPMEWHPTCHHNDPELMEKAAFFAEFGKRQYLKLMYVWGHSYEFDDRDNWGVMEEFCRYMGGRKDIWYATNIEIIDYMEAAGRLKFSGDNGMVYNPGAASVWLQIDDRAIVEVKGGAAVSLLPA